MAVIDTTYRPREFQRAIHLGLQRFSVLVLHRRAGKTVLSVNALIDAAVRHAGGDGRFAYIAPFKDQARRIAWDYVRRYTAPIPGVAYNETSLIAEFPNGSRLSLLGGENADALRGIYLDGAVLDEVAQMRPHVWHEVVQPALSDRMGWALFIGTPRGENLFHDLYLQAQRSPEWFSQVLTVYDTGAIDPDEIARLRADMPENAFRQEFLCDFSASNENALITIDMVVDAQQRVIKEGALGGLPRIMGIDVARFGGDRSAIARRIGPLLHPIKSYTGADNMHFAAIVAQEIERWQPDAVFVDGGRGEGVIDRLRQLGHFPIEVAFGGKPLNPRYANKRTEMWDLLQQWLSEGACIPDDPDLRSELVAPTYSFDAANRMILAPKRDPKQEGRRGAHVMHRSTDLADALALTFAYPVAVEHTRVAGWLAQHIKPAAGDVGFNPWEW